jgi:hypothetical protein
MSRRGGRGRGGGGRSALTSSRELLKRSAAEAGLDDRHIKVLSDITRPALFPDFLWKSTGRYWNEDDEANNTGDGVNVNVNIDDKSKMDILSLQPSNASVKKLPAAMMSTIQKQRELTHRFQMAPYFVRPNTVVDIVRYSDRLDAKSGIHAHTAPDAIVLASLSATSTLSQDQHNSNNNHSPNILTADDKYLPNELWTQTTRISKGQHDETVKRRRIQPLADMIVSNPLTTSVTTNDYMKMQETAMVRKLEELDHRESNKTRTSSITSITSNNDDDLVVTQIIPSTTRNNRTLSDADDILQLGADGNDDDEDDENVDLLEDNGEEELNEDYITNYYASEDDNDDDNDGEPTY